MELAELLKQDTCPNCRTNVNQEGLRIIPLRPDGNDTAVTRELVGSAILFKKRHDKLALCNKCFSNVSTLSIINIKNFLEAQEWSPEEIFFAESAIENIKRGWKLIGYTTKDEMKKSRVK